MIAGFLGRNLEFPAFCMDPAGGNRAKGTAVTHTEHASLINAFIAFDAFIDFRIKWKVAQSHNNQHSLSICEETRVAKGSLSPTTLQTGG